MAEYRKVKSKFIKEKIKSTKWKDRDYIDDLIAIECYVKGEMFGLGTGHKAKSLEGEYPKEWVAIWKELEPKKYEKNRKIDERERRREEKEEREMEEEEMIEEELDREDWKRVGGKF